MATQKKARVTIKDVAQLAGVSPSTVSFVINNVKHQSISPETRKRILQCADQLGYRPHYYASSIRNGKSHTIGVVTTYRVNSMYFLDLINGVMAETDQEGYGVVICPHAGKGEGLSTSFLDYFREGRIDGVVFISSAHSEEKSHECDYISLFRKHEIPFSVIYGYTDFPGVCYANTNFYEDGRRAARLLISRGCQRIGYVAALDKDNRTPYMPKTEQDRIDGYIAALREAGLSHHLFMFPRDFHAGDYTALTCEVKNLHADGFITCWATFGLQMLTLLREVGQRVPEDTRMISLDSLPYLSHTAPALSAMRMPFYEMARCGTRMLVDQLNQRPIDQPRMLFDATMEERTSTL